MIRSYDWLICASKNPEYKDEIQEIMDSGDDRKIKYKDYIIINFKVHEQCAYIEPCTEFAQLCTKVIPIKMTYSAVRKLISGNFYHLLESDIQLNLKE